MSPKNLRDSKYLYFPSRTRDNFPNNYEIFPVGEELPIFWRNTIKGFPTPNKNKNKVRLTTSDNKAICQTFPDYCPCKNRSMCLLHVLSERKSISFDTEVNCNKKTGQAMKAQVVSIFFSFNRAIFSRKRLGKSTTLYSHQDKVY